MNLVIPAISFTQRKTIMYVAAFSLEAFQRCRVDTWDVKNALGKRGYQRQADEKRVAKIAKYFELADSIMPVAGLLNVRENGRLKFKNGQLTIPDNVSLWVVDMQHRMRGIHQAFEEGILSSKNFACPVVITEGLDMLQEAAQFYLINTKAKKMDVALTRRLLIEHGKVAAVADVPEWEIRAVEATIELNNVLDSPWKHCVRPPNSEKLLTHIATEKSFVPSLRPFFAGGKSKQPKKVARRLAVMWREIKAIIPGAFEQPRRYLIQKTPGLFAFNFFIAPILLRQAKDNELNKRLAKLAKLGPDFWKRSNKSGARRFGSGMGGYAELAAYVRKQIGI